MCMKIDPGMGSTLCTFGANEGDQNIQKSRERTENFYKAGAEETRNLQSSKPPVSLVAGEL